MDPAARERLLPAFRVFLDKLNALPPVDPARVEVAERRRAFAQFALANGGDLEHCARIEDHRLLLAPGIARTLRLYYPRRPSAEEPPLPAYLYLHGGGWHAGSLTTHDFHCRRLAAFSGCVVASLDYRLAPEHVAPAAVEDCRTAYAWLCANAGSLHLAAARIGLAGDSAGANIVVGACLGWSHEAANASASASSPPPAALALIYPALDLTMSTPGSLQSCGEGYYLRAASMAHYVDLYLGTSAAAAAEAGAAGAVAAEGCEPLPPPPLAPTDPRVSPLLAAAESLAALPPIYISTAGFDPLRSEGEAFAARARAAGVAVRYHCEEDSIHAWLHHAVQGGAEVRAKTARLGSEMGALLGARDAL